MADRADRVFDRAAAEKGERIEDVEAADATEAGG